MRQYLYGGVWLLVTLELIAADALISSASAKITLRDPSGDHKYCRVFASGNGLCDFDTLDACKAELKGTDEDCLPRKSASKELTGQGDELTPKQKKELSRFSGTDALINPLMKVPGGKNRFDKSTLYMMKNFKLVQKVSGGYLITPNMSASIPSYNVEFGVAFLSTTKKLPSDLVISGAVYYAGEFKYTAMDGFEKSIPKLKIPAGLPLSGIHNDGISDPTISQQY